MNELAECAGDGGLSLGIRLAVPSARTVAYVEREASACGGLVRKMLNGQLDRAPIWTDLASFDSRPWRGVVDLISAGFPCQSFSSAGARLGKDDERWLWPSVRLTIDEVCPPLVFLENVPGVVQHGLGEILHDLAELGFDAEWGLFSAAQIGAPHLRERLFLLARHPDHCGESTLAIHDETPRVQGAGSSDSEGRWWDLPPDLRGMDDGPADQLVRRHRAIGNSVCPLQAAHAFRTLAARQLALTVNPNP